MKNFYLTTTLPYVNAAPHIGFALEIVQADVIARYKRLQGFDVFFNFGTDEHGLKIYRKAQEEKKDPQKYCDEYAAKFDALKKGLNLSYTNFIRTTDQNHIEASQEFWKKCLENGDIYKKNYKIKYCVGCELEKTDSELVEGHCPLHPNQNLEIYEEENYFFRFSKFQKPLLNLYKDNPDFVIPHFRQKEIQAFVEQGLEDFSVSRLKSKMPWGIDVPGDKDHVMYVWFDALINYISAIGWPNDLEKFNRWWPVTQFAGKDNLRQQTAIWQSMLMSAGLPNSKQVFIHGFINVGGQKISKSLGNVINPLLIAEKYGTDALRYYLLARIHPWDDSDFTIEKFANVYNADLANGLGNLVARTKKLCELIPNFKFSIKYINHSSSNKLLVNKREMELENRYKAAINEYRFNDALKIIWEEIDYLNLKIDQNKPWNLLKTNPSEAEILLYDIVINIKNIAELLLPILPNTAENILQIFSDNCEFSKPLFPRLT